MQIVSAPEHATDKIQIPYSGKFSLVQNFADLPITRPEEIFVVLNFASSLNRHHTTCVNVKFRSSYFRDIRLIRENCEILHHAKIFRYTVRADRAQNI